MKNVILPVFLFLSGMNLFAQDIYTPAQRSAWLQKAEACKPPLKETIKKPLQIIELLRSENAYQGWTTRSSGSLNNLYTQSFKKQSGVIVDFGEHLTGYYSCSFDLSDDRVSDAPTRFKFTFGEVPAEMGTPFDPYPGDLSRAWLQDEIITVESIPCKINIPRRVSFRYVKIELLSNSNWFDFKLTDMQCKAVSSADNTAKAVPFGISPEITTIYNVGLATLKECMQTVYEDGPKRDQRLWIGDLYLESLANMYSYKNHNLTKRCLYLLAALSDSEGLLHATIFEQPKPHPQKGQCMLDYALLWNLSLLEYLKASGDKETALDLWPVALKQIEIAQTFLDKNLVFNNKPITLFFDWRENFDKQASFQGLLIKVLRGTYELAGLLDKKKEVDYLPALINDLTIAGRKNFYDNKRGIVVSGTNKQIAYLSQAWMILGGVLNKKEAQKALKIVMETENAIYPGTPYSNHFMVEAMIACGMAKEAKDFVINYWGGMVKKGADTFWEVYDPNNDYLSPYNFFPVNSYCHAWSCTPVYFIGKYPEIFR